MNLNAFHKSIDGRLGGGIDVSPKDAAHAVLASLAARLTHDESTELAGELPDDIGDLLPEGTGEQPFAADDFIEDVAGRLDLDDVDAERVSLAVLGAVREALEPSPELVIESLPADLARLMHASE